VHVKLVHNKVTGASCGYGFIEFIRRDDAAACIEVMNGREVYGKRLKVTLAKPREEVRFNTNCYVAGVPPSWTADMFRQLAAYFGDVMEFRLMPAQVRFPFRRADDDDDGRYDGPIQAPPRTPPPPNARAGGTHHAVRVCAVRAPRRV